MRSTYALVNFSMAFSVSLPGKHLKFDPENEHIYNIPSMKEYLVAQAFTLTTLALFSSSVPCDRYSAIGIIQDGPAC